MTSKYSCHMIPLQDEDDSVEWIEGICDRDPYQVLDDAEWLFKLSGIHASRDEAPHEACVSSKGEVQGVSAVGLYDASPMDADPLGRPQYSFSIAVKEDARRQGIARALVKSIMSFLPRADVLLMGKVVNPNMAKLLLSLGFEFAYGDPEWSDDDLQVGVLMYRP